MATSYVVTASRLDTVKDGQRRKHYRGETITGLSEEDVARHKAAGNIATHSGKEAEAAKETPTAPNPAETSTGDPTVPESHNPEGGSASELMAAVNSTTDTTPKRPAKAADLPTWQVYAQQVGVNPDGKTKAELQELTEGKGG